MKNHRFLPRPVDLCQPFESAHSSSGGGDVTRRTFIKRSGGATAATFITWNGLTEQVRAEEEESGSCSKMCAVSPTHVVGTPDVIGTHTPPGGGTMELKFRDNTCTSEVSGNHSTSSMNSKIEIWVEAVIPEKSSQTPWILKPLTQSQQPSPDYELNKFSFESQQIKRTNSNMVPNTTYVRDVSSGLSTSGNNLKLKLKTVFNRNPTDVQLDAEAWFEGTDGSNTFTKTNSLVSGSGTSQVGKNCQEDHTDNEDCDIAPSS